MKVTKIEKLGNLPVYDISVKDAEHYILKNGVVSHNSGGMLSSDNVWIIGRSQEKDGTELLGYNFTINIEKSRYVKEKKKIPILVTFDGGIQKYSSILDLALASGDVIKPNNGYYQLVDKETGEMIGNKVREKATQCEEFLGVVLKRESFKQWVREEFQLSHMKMLSDEASNMIEEYSNPEIIPE